MQEIGDLNPAMLCQCVLSLREAVCEERYRNEATQWIVGISNAPRVLALVLVRAMMATAGRRTTARRLIVFQDTVDGCPSPEPFDHNLAQVAQQVFEQLESLRSFRNVTRPLRHSLPTTRIPTQILSQINQHKYADASET